MKLSRFQSHVSILSLFVFIFISTITSIAAPERTTYQARIVKPDGYPLETNSVNFKFTILDPAGSCSLYSETYSSVNMTGTGGLISFALGSGVKVYPTSSTTFSNVFSNITPSLSCESGTPVSYSPLASDIRKIVMQFNDGSGWQTLPSMSINAVPYAMYANEANKLNGFTSSDLVIATNAPSEKFEVVGNIKATAYLYTSDKRLKKNIETIDDSLDKILRLRGVEFDWKKSGAHEIGLIAQEVEEVEAELVETSSVDGMKSVKYGNIVAILIEAMKEEHQQVEENKKLISLMSNGLEKVDHRVRKMEREIASLKDENKKLKDDIQSIKKYLKIK